MYSFARSLAALCLVVFIVSASYAGAPESKAQPSSANISAPSSPQSDDTPATTNINVTVDALSNRHAISPYVYGGAYPQDAASITDSGLTVVRWGGNATSRYNWKLFTYNAANDWYFEDFNYSEIGDADSAKVVIKGIEAVRTLVRGEEICGASERINDNHGLRGLTRTKG